VPPNLILSLEAVERAVIDAHKPGGASLDAKAAPCSTEGTASIELAGGTEEATTAKPEALEPWAESEAWRGLETPPLPLSREDQVVLGTPLRETPRVSVLALQESTPIFLRDLAPGFPEEDPPWGIEWDSRSFVFVRQAWRHGRCDLGPPGSRPRLSGAYGR
jgi:hypothetical protein